MREACAAEQSLRRLTADWEFKIKTDKNAVLDRPPRRDVIYPLSSIVERLDLGRVFTTVQPLEVELGSGDGSFLVEYARQYPERNFIGVERLLGRIQKMERKTRKAELTNLCGVRIESSYFLQYLLPAHSVGALHVYFPDPWPKRKHRRHRLVSDHFVKLAKSVLLPGGRVYLRTDDADYYQQMVKVFAGSALFQKIDTPEKLAALLTDFETEFNARGIPTLRAAYQATP